MDPDDILGKLRAHLDAQGFGDVDIHSYGGMRPFTATPDNPLVKLTVSSGQEVYGLPTQVVPISGGSTPIYAFSGPLGGIPVVFAGVGYWDNRIHAPDEHVRVQDFLNGARHVARIMDGFGGI